MAPIWINFRNLANRYHQNCPFFKGSRYLFQSLGRVSNRYDLPRWMMTFQLPLLQLSASNSSRRVWGNYRRSLCRFGRWSCWSILRVQGCINQQAVFLLVKSWYLMCQFWHKELCIEVGRLFLSFQYVQYLVWHFNSTKCVRCVFANTTDVEPSTTSGCMSSRRPEKTYAPREQGLKNERFMKYYPPWN